MSEELKHGWACATAPWTLLLRHCTASVHTCQYSRAGTHPMIARQRLKGRQKLLTRIGKAGASHSSTIAWCDGVCNVVAEALHALHAQLTFYHCYLY